jgi:hypothetical protein
MGTPDRAHVVETRTAPPPLPSGNTENLGQVRTAGRPAGARKVPLYRDRIAAAPRTGCPAATRRSTGYTSGATGMRRRKPCGIAATATGFAKSGRAQCP